MMSTKKLHDGFTDSRKGAISANSGGPIMTNVIGRFITSEKFEKFVCKHPDKNNSHASCLSTSAFSNAVNETGPNKKVTRLEDHANVAAVANTRRCFATPGFRTVNNNNNSARCARLLSA